MYALPSHFKTRRRILIFLSVTLFLANILLSGGVKFGDLSPEMAKEFQKNLLKTMLQIENTFFDLATSFVNHRPHLVCVCLSFRGKYISPLFVGLINLVPPSLYFLIGSKGCLHQLDVRLGCLCTSSSLIIIPIIILFLWRISIGDPPSTH